MELLVITSELDFPTEHRESRRGQAWLGCVAEDVPYILPLRGGTGTTQGLCGWPVPLVRASGSPARTPRSAASTEFSRPVQPRDVGDRFVQSCVLLRRHDIPRGQGRTAPGLACPSRSHVCRWGLRSAVPQAGPLPRGLPGAAALSRLRRS